MQRFLEQGAYPHVTREEFLLILAASADLETRLLLEVLWTTGCRISEALSLSRASILRQGTQYSLNMTRLKRRKPLRETLPIPIEIGIKLDDYARLRGIEGEVPLFTKSRVTVWRAVKQLGREALHREIHPHMLRHGRIYDLARRGEHPFLIARAVGHVNIQTTLGYFHPGEEDIRNALSQ